MLINPKFQHSIQKIIVTSKNSAFLGAFTGQRPTSGANLDSFRVTLRYRKAWLFLERLESSDTWFSSDLTWFFDVLDDLNKWDETKSCIPFSINRTNQQINYPSFDSQQFSIYIHLKKNDQKNN